MIGPAFLGGVDVGVLGRVFVFGRVGGRVRLSRCMLLRRRRRADAVALSCGAFASMSWYVDGGGECCHRADRRSATGSPDAFDDAEGVRDRGKNHINVEMVNTDR